LYPLNLSRRVLCQLGSHLHINYGKDPCHKGELIEGTCESFQGHVEKFGCCL